MIFFYTTGILMPEKQEIISELGERVREELRGL